MGKYREFLLLPALLSGLVFLDGGSNLEAAEPDTSRDAVVQWFESGAQPLVESAAWSARNVFNIGVHYMGVDQSDLAREACKGPSE